MRKWKLSTPEQPTEKLQKVLSRSGLGSRREIETWINSGRVKVNSVVAHLGQRVSADAHISLDDQPVKVISNISESRQVLLYHKPECQVCTRHDPEGRPTVFDHLPEANKGRWIMVGRLDYNTSGLLLFTNDGEYANQLLHPKFHLKRVYAVRIFGKVSEVQLQQLLAGIELDDGWAKFDQIEFMGGEGINLWYKVTISIGRNRIVRRMWEALGVKVNRLMRLEFGDIVLPKTLKPGEFAILEP